VHFWSDRDSDQRYVETEEGHSSLVVGVLGAAKARAQVEEQDKRCEPELHVRIPNLWTILQSPTECVKFPSQCGCHESREL
jgi:hypothetical protein